MITDITPLLGRVHQTDCLPFMRSLPDKCPIMVKACMDTIPTRKSCAKRLKAYFLRKVK